MGKNDVELPAGRDPSTDQLLCEEQQKATPRFTHPPDTPVALSNPPTLWQTRSPSCPDGFVFRASKRPRDRTHLRCWGSSTVHSQPFSASASHQPPRPVHLLQRSLLGQSRWENEREKSIRMMNNKRKRWHANASGTGKEMRADLSRAPRPTPRVIPKAPSTAMRGAAALAALQRKKSARGWPGERGPAQLERQDRELEK